MHRLLFILLILSLDVSAQEQKSFTCNITSDRVIYNIGETPDISVSIKNNTSSSVMLVNTLEGSDYQMRYPYCYFMISKIGDTAYKAKNWGRCANRADIDLTDFIEVFPGKEFNPYFNNPRYAPDFQISDSANFSKKGKYRITFYYSTNEPDFKKWTGMPSELNALTIPILIELLARVPKVDIKSNGLVIEFR